GAELKWVFDNDTEKIEKLCKSFPEAKAARSEEEALNDPAVRLIASAAVPADRCGMGLKALAAGKHYFSDKPAFTTLEQLDRARRKTRETNLKFAVYYSERLHVEASVYAGGLIENGMIGRVIQVVGLGPHRMNPASRPDWFFKKDAFGGILCDLGSHQIEQFLYFAGAKDAKVLHSKVANYHYKQHPEFEDFGDATLLADNGASNYFRVDWFTPDGLGVWGDGRTFILGTEGYIELRKYIDIARDAEGDHVYLVDHEGEKHFSVHGKTGYPFFGNLILDCLNGTEKAMTQEHAFKAAELSVKAQLQAVRVE
ncbi:MAG TPA: Gfo/Idh/MocA family oxidoreductase, partial [Spirochaetia bacterium]|nr:Gfo/Idh/MocA family oxidoreductase [Spirochaetia bacterium]